MSKTFCLIGDPGPGGNAMLKLLRDAGLDPRRTEPSSESLAELAEDRPIALAIGDGIANRRELVAELRERPVFDEVPVLVRIGAPDPAVAEQAFADGADDLLIDDTPAQFAALIKSLQSKDVWSAVRAPTGLVLLADAGRQERVRMAHVLRRNGFDIHFAADLGELERALDSDLAPRAVVASAQLPGGSLIETLQRIAADGKAAAPWVIINAGAEERAINEVLVANTPRIAFGEGGDAEHLTFLMNELLSPIPPNVRRTPRLLYGTLASFTHEGSTDVFHGYTYNVNQGGLFVRTLTPSPLNSRIEIRFRPPNGIGEVVAKAQVVWRREFSASGGAASPPGIGVQFVDWAVADKAGFEAGYAALRAGPKGDGGDE
jgi:CheY-like chemotaxis protein